jgi:hypothetical protein
MLPGELTKHIPSNEDAMIVMQMLTERAALAYIRLFAWHLHDLLDEDRGTRWLSHMHREIDLYNKVVGVAMINGWLAPVVPGYSKIIDLVQRAISTSTMPTISMVVFEWSMNLLGKIWGLEPLQRLGSCEVAHHRKWWMMDGRSAARTRFNITFLKDNYLDYVSMPATSDASLVIDFFAVSTEDLLNDRSTLSADGSAHSIVTSLRCSWDNSRGNTRFIANSP